MKRVILALLLSTFTISAVEANSQKIPAKQHEQQTEHSQQFLSVQTILRTQNTILQKLMDPNFSSENYAQWLKNNHQSLQINLAKSELLRHHLFPKTIVARDSQGHLLNNYKQNHLLNAQEREDWFQKEHLWYQEKAKSQPQELNLEERLKTPGASSYDFVLKYDHSIKVSPIELVGNPLTEDKWAHPNHTILAGKSPLLSAGNFTLVQNAGKRAIFISNKSGHFLPAFEDLEAFKKQLILAGIPETEIFTVSMSSIYANTVYKYFYDDQLSLNLQVLPPLKVYRYYLNIWEQAQQTQVLPKVLERIQNKGIEKINAEDIAVLKKDRKTGHWLRSAFYLFSVGHRPPQDFEDYIILYGKLNDALINQDQESAKASAHTLRKLLETQKVSKAAQLFQPSEEEDFKANINSTRQKIEASLKKSKLLIHDMHMMRIHFKQYLNLYQTMNELTPFDSLVDLNRQHLEHVIGFLGDKHDDYIQEDLEGEIDYDHSWVNFNDEERKYMLQVLNKAHQPLNNTSDSSTQLSHLTRLKPVLSLLP